MALAIATVTNSIASLSVSGVSIKDIHDIPPAALPLRTPVLFPDPLNFVSSFSMERNSYGGGSTAKMTVTYTLNYTFCFTPIGDGRNAGLDHYDEMVAKAALILDAILAIDTLSGAIDITPQSVVEFGPVPDPAGFMHLGCRLALTVQEFVN